MQRLDAPAIIGILRQCASLAAELQRQAAMSHRSKAHHAHYESQGIHSSPVRIAGCAA